MAVAVAAVGSCVSSPRPHAGRLMQLTAGHALAVLGNQGRLGPLQQRADAARRGRRWTVFGLSSAW